MKFPTNMQRVERLIQSTPSNKDPSIVVSAITQIQGTSAQWDNFELATTRVVCVS